MTDSEWSGLTDPTSLLLHLRLRRRPRTSPRKLRLFGCAALRHIDHLLPEEHLRQAIAAVERFCDDRERLQDMRDARAAVVSLQEAFREAARAHEVEDPWSTSSPDRIESLLNFIPRARRSVFLTVVAARALTTLPRSQSDHRLNGKLARWVADYAAMAARRAGRILGNRERDYQVDLLRDIFGNPFRAVTTDPAWLAWNDRTSPNLAQAIYDEPELPSGHFDTGRLAILADALEESGCADADILGHCWSPGPHVRGCWVVDLILSKCDPDGPQPTTKNPAGRNRQGR